jgi:nitroimidazol reductase NimA-like FMN-containing flavoprotein (pyridoxamine 5'-phosphate oxidase superfamily)
MAHGVEWPWSHVMRTMTTVPRQVLGAASRLRTSALDNALTATQALATSLADRRALAPADEPEPGGVSRLERAECLRLLRSRSIGRLAYVARAGVPDIVPVNYAVEGEDVVIRTGPGPKLQAAERRELVAFEVDDLDDARHTGWSVVVVGKARRLTEQEAGALARGAAPVGGGSPPTPRAHHAGPRRRTPAELTTRPW